MTAMLWVYGIAAATALALAEHWLRYALVERKRHRRAAARLERIRRSRERREDAIQPARHGVRGAMHGCTCIECKPWLRRYKEQARDRQGISALEAQNMAMMGLNLTAQSAQTGTGPFPAPDTWRDPLLDGPRGVTARGTKRP